MVASDTTQTYHVAVVGYLACGLVLTTSSVNSLVYSANGAKEAASAGFILLSMVTVSRLHSSSVLVHGTGHFACFRVVDSMADLVNNRLFGSFISALRHRLFRVPTLIPLR